MRLLVWLLLASLLPDYDAVKNLDRYATKAEYETARSDASFALTKVSYRSGGLTVHAYVYAPAKTASKLPVIVFNRGSWTWKEFAGEYLTTFHRLAEAGFVVVSPMIRGSGGAEGRDELGGADLDDVMNTAALLRTLPYADTNNVFLYGESRGGMMVYQAIRDRYPANAAAVYGAFTDLGELAAKGGRYEQAAAAIWPDLAEQREAIIARRSALQWADKLDTPLLIMHGGNDRDVPPSQAIALAARLQALDKPYELMVRSGANHVLTQWRAERDALAVEWFRRHMKK